MAKAYADWCFERRNQLPPEWTAVDTATTEAKAQGFQQELMQILRDLNLAETVKVEFE